MSISQGENVAQEKYRWSQMDKLKLGRHGEHLVCLELLALNFDIYTVDVDDHGIDLIVRRRNGPFYEFQIKANRNLTSIYFRKAVFSLRDNLYAVVVTFFEGEAPKVYLITSMVWLHPNALFVERNYGQEGQISEPEWGLNFSQRNLTLLEPYPFDVVIQQLL